MCSKKVKWTKPLLTVLVRGKPEENILISCKTLAGPLVSSSNNYDRACEFWDENIVGKPDPGHLGCTSRPCEEYVTS
jgi:hypothetical protein